MQIAFMAATGQSTHGHEGGEGEFNEDDKQYFREIKTKPFIGQTQVLKQLFGHPVLQMA